MKHWQRLAAAAVMGMASIGAVQAQGAASAPGPGPGPGMGPGPGPGMGPGMGRGGMHGQRMNGDNTHGWSLMTPAERQQHHDAMVAMKTYAECQAYRDRHHALMVERAKSRGQAMPAAPRHDACAPLRP